MYVFYDLYYLGMVRLYIIVIVMFNGWIWDIFMVNQCFVGYVYVSQFIFKEVVECELRVYQGLDIDNLLFCFVDFKVGYCKWYWVNNCIVIGLSGGFIELLEFIGLFLVDIGVVLLVEYFFYSV